MYVARGEIYYVYLDPVFGHEAGGFKQRPVAIISIPDIHKSGMVVAVPGTTTPSAYPNVVKVDARHVIRCNPTFQFQDTYYQCHQVRALDQGRLTGRAIGKLSDHDLAAIERGVIFSLGLLTHQDADSLRKLLGE